MPNAHVSRCPESNMCGVTAMGPLIYHVTVGICRMLPRCSIECRGAARVPMPSLEGDKMIGNPRRPAPLRPFSWLLIALLCIGIVPAAAQDVTDDFSILSEEVGSGETVAVLVTGWHPVTGEAPEVNALAEDGGMVAVTGDEFLKSVSGSGEVADVRRFQFLPAIAMTMDANALDAARSYDDSVKVWKDWPVEPYLSDSGPMVGADRAHGGGYTGRDTWIAVIDTGVDIEHPFIAGRPIAEACFADRCPNGRKKMTGDGAARPVHSHGTHVAGIALGRGDGMSGVAPDAGLIAINVFNPDGGARNSNILAALDWLIGIAWTRPVTIASVNMSLGAPVHRSWPCEDQLYDLAAEYLARRDVVIVAAAGNESKADGISHPACVEDIVSVGAIDKGSRIARFSNSAPILDMLAPGVDINSSVPRSRGGKAPFEEYPGTSMAAPHVAGAYAVLRQAAPFRSIKDLYRALVGSGEDIRDRRNGITKPALDVAGALEALGVQSGADAASPAESHTPADEEDGWKPITE